MTSAQRINQYLRKYGSPLAGYGNAFVRAGRRYGIDPALLVAISGAESSFGKILSGSHNAWGWGPGISFPSWQAGIQAIAKGLRQGYLGQGLTTIEQIGQKWAPGGAANDPTNLNANWAGNVKHFYSELTGGTAPTMASGGAVSPSDGLGGASAAPDLSSAVMASLSDIGSGHFDAAKSLSDLVGAVKTAGAPAAGTTPAAGGDITSAPAGTGITYAGQRLTHQTDGLPGYPAIDLFAPAGTPFDAPENGRVVRLSGRGGVSGNVFGYSVYFQGDSGKTYFITHLAPGGRPRPGTRVRRGQPLGRVSRWTSGSSHAHVGIHG